MKSNRHWFISVSPSRRFSSVNGFPAQWGTVILIFFILACSGTRPDRLGPAEGRLAPCPESPNCVSSFAEDPEHRVEPLSFQGSPEKVMEAVHDILVRLDRVHIVTQKELYLYAEFTSFFFRFVDDVEFLIDPETRTLHFRSASRLGRSDLGVNRKRIESIRKTLAAQNL